MSCHRPNAQNPANSESISNLQSKISNQSSIFIERIFNSLAHMYPRASQWIRLALTQHLSRHRRGVALAEREELQQIQERVALGPSEVRVRNLPGLVAD